MWCIRRWNRGIYYRIRIIFLRNNFKRWNFFEIFIITLLLFKEKREEEFWGVQGYQILLPNRPVYIQPKPCLSPINLIRYPDNSRGLHPGQPIAHSQYPCSGPGFKSYKILLKKFENPSTHSSQDPMEIFDTILKSKLKFPFILLMILVFYNIILISFLQFS